jgi:hypothetical protein
MQTLVCESVDCMYNDSRKCSANVIQVNFTRQDTYCDTYTKKDTFVADQTDKMPHITDNVPDAEFGAETDDSPRISCTASMCVYNKAFRCKARGVEIDDPHDSNICNCNTYRPK